MRKLRLLKLAFIVVAFCGRAIAASPAQATLTTLYNFNDGLPYAGLIQANDGNFYGTTAAGGIYCSGGNGSACGTVFQLTPGGALTFLVSFAGLDGDWPESPVIQATDGNFYGTTQDGGSAWNPFGGGGSGVVFRVSASGALTMLYSFCSLPNCTDGAGPMAGLIQAKNGNFYGTTSGGGANGQGMVFEITPSGTLTTLYSFCAQSNCTDGKLPEGPVVQANDGNFYGTTIVGGAYGEGTVFQLTPGGTLTTLHSFSGADGLDPRAALIQANDGNLYGTTEGGGTGNYGTIFKLTLGGTLTTLHNFGGADGAGPTGVIQASDNNFYGTTASGGTNSDGTIFQLTEGGTLTTLYSFAGADGQYPLGQLLQGTDKNFYGTTQYGGTYNFGTVFKLVVNTPVFTPMVYFNGKNGEQPQAPPVQGLNGNLYGTTAVGGTGSGVIYQMTTAGKYTKLYSFCAQTGCPDGEEPYAPLVQATDGNLYGTTLEGGAYGWGTVFRITATGKLTTLHSFCAQAGCPDGSFPLAGLVPANGKFYGTTSTGGAHGSGTVFEITKTGALTTLYNFCSQPNCTDGASPYAALVQGSNGNFYGTTISGGNGAGCTFSKSGCGTVFEITPSGTLTTLYVFCTQTNCADGESPASALIQHSNGNLYGTTTGGGTGAGTFFEISPSGELTFLYSFCAQPACDDGAAPYGILQASDGNVYGTSGAGGASGSVFEFTPAGELVASFLLCDTCGLGPASGLTQATNGVFYGTAVDGGSNMCFYGCGTVFSFSNSLGSFVETLPTSGNVGAEIGILGTSLTGATAVSFNGTPATFKVSSGTLITTHVPSGATTGPVAVALPSGTLVSNIPFYVVP